jgi:flagellar L-ring protein FlgH
VTVNGVPILETDLQSDHSFDGEGDSAQSNSLTGNITVTVSAAPRQRQPGHARPEVAGAEPGQGVRAHRGRRAPDRHRAGQLDPVLEGGRRADRYGGRGALAESNSMGWLARFFNSPIMPF